MDIKLKFGNHLKLLREKNNWTQEKLSELSNIDRSYISDIERWKNLEFIEKNKRMYKYC